MCIKRHLKWDIAWDVNLTRTEKECLPGIPALEKLRKEDLEFKAYLGHMLNSRLT